MHSEDAVIRQVINDFLGSYERRNVDGCMSYMSSAKPFLFLGTNANEVFKTSHDLREAFHKDFSTFTDIHWGEYRHIAIIGSPTLASAVLEVPFSFQVKGKKQDTLFRFALTLQKQNDQWKICLAMASIPHAADTVTFS